ncbi:DUF4126 domain-containing protein [Nocardioides solisilvae]|uniref:DUF4126 domain-containing protein n=1 Tax=Nocardioides solisilvae TaxID=1542435 RepID=UPI000D74B85E|nr:DUF4126 domain-containing protein [Nocardioides solisilvae]
MLAALTGTGLSAAAGLNAYIPFLVVALVARFTDAITLPEGYAWIESWWAIGIGALLLLVEVVLDKIPVVDSVNDAIQTAIRPATGGLVFAATQAAEDLEESTGWFADNPWLGVVVGVVVSAVVHGGKAVARPAIDAGSLGTATPVVSTAEDGFSVGLALAAVFWPVLVVVLLVVLAAVLGAGVVVVLRWRRRRAARREGPGASASGTDRGRTR